MDGATASAFRSTARSAMPSTDGPTTRSWRTTTRGRRWRRSQTRCRCAVQLASGRTSYSISGASKITVVDEGGSTTKKLPAGSYRVERGTSGRLRVVDAATNARVVKHLTGPVRLSASQALRVDSTVGIGWAHDHWHGALRVIRSGSSLMLVDVVPLEYYLRGVVPSEMPSSWLTAGAPRPGRRRALIRRRDAPPDVALRRLRRHAQPGLRPDGARGGRVERGRRRRPRTRCCGTPATSPSGSSRRRRADGRRPSRRPGAAAASRISSPSATATTAPRDSTRTTIGSRGSSRRAGWPAPLGRRRQGALGRPDDRRALAAGHARHVPHGQAGDRGYTGPGAELALGLRSNYFRIVGATLTGADPVDRRLAVLAHRACLAAAAPPDLAARARWPGPAVDDGRRQALAQGERDVLDEHPPEAEPRVPPRAPGRRGLAAAEHRGRAGAHARPLRQGVPRDDLSRPPRRDAHAPAAPVRRLEGGRPRARSARSGHARFAVPGHEGRWRVSFGGDAQHAGEPLAGAHLAEDLAGIVFGTCPRSPSAVSTASCASAPPGAATRRATGASTSRPTWSRCSPRAAGWSAARATSCTSSTGAGGPCSVDLGI